MERLLLKSLFSSAVLCLLILAAQGGQLRPCFTQGEDCTSLIVEAINRTRSELLVQAYGFTSTPILEAIVEAKTRGAS